MAQQGEEDSAGAEGASSDLLAWSSLLFDILSNDGNWSAATAPGKVTL
jgi:hypothetical protein